MSIREASAVRRFGYGFMIGSLIAIPLTVAVTLVRSWFFDNIVVVSLIAQSFWLTVFIVLFIVVQRRGPVQPGYGLVVLGFFIGTVVMPFVTSLVLAFGSIILDNWRFSLFVMGWALAITFFVLWLRLKIYRRRGFRSLTTTP